MFEAILEESVLLKKIIESIKDLLNEASLDCSENGIYLQAMDSSHVALVSFLLRTNAFESYTCDKNLSLGLNLSSITRILKCSSNNDKLTLKTDDENPDTLNFIFESQIGDKISNFEMRLMNLDIEHLGIPDTEYSCVIKMASNEFTKICRDLSGLGDSMTISCTKSGVNFMTSGELGNAIIKLKQRSNQESININIKLTEPVSLTFSLRYLIFFTKGAPLSSQVSICMSEDTPISKIWDLFSFH